MVTQHCSMCFEVEILGVLTLWHVLNVSVKELSEGICFRVKWCVAICSLCVPAFGPVTAGIDFCSNGNQTSDGQLDTSDSHC